MTAEQKKIGRRKHAPDGTGPAPEIKSQTQGRSGYAAWAAACFACAVILRVLLCWVNPPQNAFDDHFKPIFLIMDTGSIPAKDACWQCYHPPVFYWLSAMAGKAAAARKIPISQTFKLLQFLPCLYGILTVALMYLILRKLPLSGFSRLIAFGTVCFLPRHIYMSSMNSNDTISYLFVALSVYVLLLALERKLSFTILLLAGSIISITLFTKYTAFALLPAALAVVASLVYKRLNVSRSRLVAACILLLIVPITILGLYMLSNSKSYGSPLPWNIQKLDPSQRQPRDSSRLDFLSFKPWESIGTPMLVPGKMHSFWTLVYSGMWFDNEPKYLHYLDSNKAWWGKYFRWRRENSNFPGDNPSMTHLTRVTGAGLLAAGLLPLFLVMSGICVFLRGTWKALTRAQEMDVVKMNIFPALLASNAAGIIALAIRLPVYGSAKASYFLTSLPAFAVFLCLGLMQYEKNKYLKPAMLAIFGVLCALASLHILHIVQSVRSAMP